MQTIAEALATNPTSRGINSDNHRVIRFDGRDHPCLVVGRQWVRLVAIDGADPVERDRAVAYSHKRELSALWRKARAK